MQSAGCRLFRKSQEAQGESSDVWFNLAVETYGQIRVNSHVAGCEGMATTATP